MAWWSKLGFPEWPRCVISSEFCIYWIVLYFRQAIYVNNAQVQTVPKMMLMAFLLMTYYVANGKHLYAATNLTSVADTIFLQCHHGFKVRSRLELSTACSSEASCRAIRTNEWGTSSMWCGCPKKITWPRSWNYELSTIRQRRLMEPLPGKKAK